MCEVNLLALFNPAWLDITFDWGNDKTRPPYGMLCIGTEMASAPDYAELRANDVPNKGFIEVNRPTLPSPEEKGSAYTSTCIIE